MRAPLKSWTTPAMVNPESAKRKGEKQNTKRERKMAQHDLITKLSLASEDQICILQAAECAKLLQKQESGQYPTNLVSI
jgi:hypothetical protein